MKCFYNKRIMGFSSANGAIVIFYRLGIVALLLCHSCSCGQTENSKANSLSTIGSEQRATLKEMPQFEAKDINSQPISYNQVQGKTIFVDFIDPKQREQINILSNLYGEFGNYNNFSIIVFLEGTGRISQDFLIFDKIYIIPDPKREYRRLFNVPPCCEEFYLFDEKGNLIKSGPNRWNYEQVIRVPLKKMLENRVFSITNFLNSADNLRNALDHKEAGRIFIENKSDYYLFAFVRDFCNSCSSGQIIQRLNELQRKSKSQISIVLCLPPNFSSQDIKHLKQQMKIDYDVQVVDLSFASNWEEQVKEFGPSFITNILILGNYEGHVINSAFPECNCLTDFFRDVLRRLN